MADQAPARERFLEISYDEFPKKRYDDRWQFLKEAIIYYFMDKNLTLPKLAETMRRKFEFDAQ